MNTEEGNRYLKKGQCVGVLKYLIYIYIYLYIYIEREIGERWGGGAESENDKRNMGKLKSMGSYEQIRIARYAERFLDKSQVNMD